MSYRTQCPNCDATFNLKSPDVFGKRIRCKSCENPFVAKPLAKRRPAPPPLDESGDDIDDFDQQQRRSVSNQRKKGRALWRYILIFSLLGVGAIVTVVIVIVNQSGGSDGEKTKPAVANRPITDDGSPVFIHNPRFAKFDDGRIVLLFDYQLKKMKPIPHLPYTVLMHAGEKKGKKYELDARTNMSGKRLIAGETGRLYYEPIGKTLDGEAYLHNGVMRVSNILKLKFPDSADKLPMDPLVLKIQKSAKSVRLVLSNVRTKADRQKRWEVKIRISSGKTDDEFRYALIAHVKGINMEKKPDKSGRFLGYSRKGLTFSLQELRQKGETTVSIGDPDGYVRQRPAMEFWMEAQHKSYDVNVKVSDTISWNPPGSPK